MVFTDLTKQNIYDQIKWNLNEVNPMDNIGALNNLKKFTQYFKDEPFYNEEHYQSKDCLICHIRISYEDTTNNNERKTIDADAFIKDNISNSDRTSIFVTVSDSEGAISGELTINKVTDLRNEPIVSEKCKDYNQEVDLFIRSNPNEFGGLTKDEKEEFAKNFFAKEFSNILYEITKQDSPDVIENKFKEVWNERLPQVLELSKNNLEKFVELPNTNDDDPVE